MQKPELHAAPKIYTKVLQGQNDALCLFIMSFADGDQNTLAFLAHTHRADDSELLPEL